jgi:hypothetical protein
VKCADIKIDLPLEDFYGQQDSMEKLCVKIGEKHAEGPQTTP